MVHLGLVQYRTEHVKLAARKMYSIFIKSLAFLEIIVIVMDISVYFC